MSLHQPQLYCKVEMPEAETPCIHQARLPPDQESSFSSLDSEIVSKHYGRKQFEQPHAYRSPVYRKYQYLDRSPNPSERAGTFSLRKGSGSNHEFTLQNSGRIQDYHSRDDKQKRIDELLTENQVLRGQLQMLKSTNSNIQIEVRKGSEEIKRMRRQLDRNFSEHHQDGGINPTLQDQLKEKVTSLESKTRQFQNDLQLARRKYQHEKQKTQRLQRQVKGLKQSLRNTEDKFDQEIVKQNKGIRLTQEDSHRQTKYIRKMEERLREAVKSLEQQKQQYNSLMVRFKQAIKKDNSHWKENFITVFLDMMKRVGEKQNFAISQQLSLKKQTKLAWRYLKRLIHDYLGHPLNYNQ